MPENLEPPVPSTMQVLQRVTDEFASAVAGLKEEVKTTFRNSSEQMAVIEKRIEDLVKAQNAMPQIVEMGEFDPFILKNSATEPDRGQEQFNCLLRAKAATGRPELDALINGLQQKSDMFYLAKRFRDLHRANNGQDPMTRHEMEDMPTFKAFNRMRKYLANALDTQTALEGGNWIPTGMSAQVIEKVALSLTVAGLFPSFQIPGTSFDWPFETALPVAKLMSGVIGGGNVRGEPTGPVDPYDGTYLAATGEIYSGAPTGKKTFTPNKLRALAVLSREVSDDMIIATMPWLIGRIVYAMTSGWDDAVVNGDTAGTHMDTDTTGVSNVRKAINGIRDYIYGVGGLGAATAGVDMGGAAPTTVKLRAVRAKMGVFGQMLSDLAWLASPVGAIHLLNLPEVITADKLGANATILRGQLAALDSIPIVISGYKRDDVNNLGVNGSSGNTFTSIECVHRPNFLWATRPGLGVETERLKLSDQSFAVMFDRRDWGYIGAATDRVVGGLYNITTTV